MSAIFWNTLGKLRGQTIGWGIGLFLLGLLLVPFFNTIASEADRFQDLLSAYPPEMMAFFGDMSTLATPEGYLSLEYFSLMPVIIGIFAVLAGSGLIASDEENGTMDLILAHPVSRASLFVGRVLALVVATILIFTIAWLGIVIPAAFSPAFDLTPLEIAIPFVSLLAVTLLFAALGLLFSMLLPSRRMAAMLGGVLLIASYFVTSLAKINDSLATLAKISPLNYYQSGEAISDGVNVGWFAGLLVAALLFMALAGWLFQKRDIRVAGEGGWRLAMPRRHYTST